MKIIVLGTRGFPNVQGGIEKHCEDLYPRLAELGCEVAVLARAPYVGLNMYMYKGVTVFPTYSPKHKYLETFVHTFLGIIKARFMNPDVLHIHAIGPALFVPFARLLGLKVVVTHHGPDYDRQKWNGIAKAILRLGETLGMTYAHHVIVISKVIAESVREKFGRETTLIPNGVNVIRRTDEDDVLRKFNLERGKYLLTVGRFVPEKGFNDLVESFYLMSKELQTPNRLKLVIVGDADHEDDFSRKLKQMSSTIPNVVLTGYQTGNALRELYSHASHFVLPSYHEGLPIALLEALSYGLSCLVSDIPANREVGLEEARYFNPGDINLMARKFNEYMDRSTNEEQRARRIQHITNKYNWAQIAQKTHQVYGYAVAYGGLVTVNYEKKPVFSLGTAIA